MNGVHDMGGMYGFGPVKREENEPVFHERWEARLDGMRNVVGPAPGLRPGGFRFATESLDPAVPGCKGPGRAAPVRAASHRVAATRYSSTRAAAKVTPCWARYSSQVIRVGTCSLVTLISSRRSCWSG